MRYSKDIIEKLVKSNGYSWFENGDFNLNIVGVRNSQSNLSVTNLFDDVISLSFKENNEWKYFEWSCTTDPGKKAVQNFENKKGIARLVPGQYKKTYMVDLHNGKYNALCQRLGNVKVYRDADKNLIYNENIIDTGMFGINIHRSSIYKDPTYVDYFSAGCQVFRYNTNFIEFMKIVNKSKELYGNRFTYTLIESKYIK